MKVFATTITFVLLAASIGINADEASSIDGKIDPYCLEDAPTVSEPCTKREIWTYDTTEEKCVQKQDCFENGGPEYNIFPTELGCNRWCHMIYE